MIRMNWIMILMSILYILTNAELDNNFNLLPQSILELKQYYDFIINLEKRGVINTEVADKEKRLYIEYASKLSGKKELFIDVFTTYNQRQSIISFSSIIEILAGIIISIAFIVFLKTNIPALSNTSESSWEILLYVISICIMMLSSSSALILVGCFIFLIMLPITISVHSINLPNYSLTISRIYFIVWTIIAIYQQSETVGYLAIIALESLLIKQKFMEELIVIIGFERNEIIIPSATIASFISLLIGCILRLQQPNFLTIPFTRPLLFLGTSVYFIGMFILTSRMYTEWGTRKYLFWLLQFITFFSGLATMFFGPSFNLPFIQAIGGTMFVIWLLDKYLEFAPWKGPLATIGSLLGFALFLYGLTCFLKMNSEYFIFHSYSSK